MSAHPIGFFWDIENCSIPSSKSAFNLVQLLRERFGHAGSEVEFVVVCDVTKERQEVLNELNLAQVSVVHVSATCKNAADEKLKGCLRKFASVHKPPASVVLISSDVNFAPELSELRYRYGFDVILIHRRDVSAGLLACAQETISWKAVIDTLPDRNLPVGDDRKKANHNPPAPQAESSTFCRLVISKLPAYIDSTRIRERLSQLSDNCGGKVESVNSNANSAIIKFPNYLATQRAKKRLHNEDVFGCKIHAQWYRPHKHLNNSNPQFCDGAISHPNSKSTANSVTASPALFQSTPPTQHHHLVHRLLAAEAVRRSAHQRDRSVSIPRRQDLRNLGHPNHLHQHQNKATPKSHKSVAASGGRKSRRNQRSRRSESRDRRRFNVAEDGCDDDDRYCAQEHRPRSISNDRQFGGHKNNSYYNKTNNDYGDFYTNNNALNNECYNGAGGKSNQVGNCDSTINSSTTETRKISENNLGDQRLKQLVPYFEENDLGDLLGQNKVSKSVFQPLQPSGFGRLGEFGNLYRPGSDLKTKNFPGAIGKFSSGKNFKLKEARISAVPEGVVDTTEETGDTGETEEEEGSASSDDIESPPEDLDIELETKRSPVCAKPDQLVRFNDFTSSKPKQGGFSIIGTFGGARTDKQETIAAEDSDSDEMMSSRRRMACDAVTAELKNLLKFGGPSSCNMNQSVPPKKSGTARPLFDFSSPATLVDPQMPPVFCGGVDDFCPKQHSSPLGSPKLSRSGIKLWEPSFHSLGPARRRTPSTSPDGMMVDDPVSVEIDPFGNLPPNFGPVDLRIDNLDSKMHIKDLKRALYQAFDEFVSVLHVTIVPQSSGHCHAIVQVATVRDARLAIERAPSIQVGTQRLVIGRCVPSGCTSPVPGVFDLRESVVSVLSETPAGEMGWEALAAIIKNKHDRSITPDDIGRLRDLVRLTNREDPVGGRCLTLVTLKNHLFEPDEWEDGGAGKMFARKRSLSRNAVEGNIVESPATGQPYCRTHCPNFSNGPRILTSRDGNVTGVCTMMSLVELDGVVERLLNEHGGILPVASFMECYAASFSSPIRNVEPGIPLGHLLNSLSRFSVDPYSKRCSSEVIRFMDKPRKEVLLNCELKPIHDEIVGLLEEQAGVGVSYVPIREFYVLYEKMYGNCLNPPVYGHFTLDSLLQALNRSVEVIGSGENSVVMLSHQANLNRFVRDVKLFFHKHMDVSARNTEVNVGELKALWEDYVGLTLNPLQYGVCYLKDLLAELPKFMFTVTGTGDTALVTLSRRSGSGSTSPHSPYLKSQCQEIVDLIRRMPHYRVALTELANLYREAYGRTLRSSPSGSPGEGGGSGGGGHHSYSNNDGSPYSYNRLVEMLKGFEDVLIIEYADGQEFVTLPKPEMFRSLCTTAVAMLSAQPQHSLPLAKFEDAFAQFEGHPISLSDFDCKSVEGLIKKLGSVLKIAKDDSGTPLVHLAAQQEECVQADHVLYCFLANPDAKMSYGKLVKEYFRLFQRSCGTLERLKATLKDVLVFEEVRTSPTATRVNISLTPMQNFALRAHHLIINHQQNSIPISDFQLAYRHVFHETLNPQLYGFSTVPGLIRGVSHVLYVKGRGSQAIVCVNRNFLDSISVRACPPSRSSSRGHSRSGNRGTAPSRYDSYGQGGHGSSSIDRRSPFRRANSQSSRYYSPHGGGFENPRAGARRRESPCFDAKNGDPRYPLPSYTGASNYANEGAPMGYAIQPQLHDPRTIGTHLRRRERIRSSESGGVFEDHSGVLPGHQDGFDDHQVGWDIASHQSFASCRIGSLNGAENSAMFGAAPGHQYQRQSSDSVRHPNELLNGELNQNRYSCSPPPPYSAIVPTGFVRCGGVTMIHLPPNVPMSSMTRVTLVEGSKTFEDGGHKLRSPNSKRYEKLSPSRLAFRSNATAAANNAEELEFEETPVEELLTPSCAAGLRLPTGIGEGYSALGKSLENSEPISKRNSNGLQLSTSSSGGDTTNNCSTDLSTTSTRHEETSLSSSHKDDTDEGVCSNLGDSKNLEISSSPDNQIVVLRRKSDSEKQQPGPAELKATGQKRKSRLAVKFDAVE